MGNPFRPSPALASGEKSTVVSFATNDLYLIHSHNIRPMGWIKSRYINLFWDALALRRITPFGGRPP
ncbi:MAG: hypothetical protein MG2_1236 [uncultured Candidatus Poseidoniales archaeon]|nr:MAG: hypothetical protein MG2_1236 [uncultured Candidatus Poseidoniales archaeon]